MQPSQPEWDNIQTNFDSLKDEAIKSLRETAVVAKKQITQIREETLAKLRELEADTDSNAITNISCTKDEACRKVDKVLHAATAGLNLLSEESRELLTELLTTMNYYLGGSSKSMEKALDSILQLLGHLALDLVRDLKQSVKELKKELQEASSSAKKYHKKNKKILSQMQINSAEAIKELKKSATMHIDKLALTMTINIKDIAELATRNLRELMKTVKNYVGNREKEVAKTVETCVQKVNVEATGLTNDLKETIKNAKKDINTTVVNALRVNKQIRKNLQS